MNFDLSLLRQNIVFDIFELKSNEETAERMKNFKVLLRIL